MPELRGTQKGTGKWTSNEEVTVLAPDNPETWFLFFIAALAVFAIAVAVSGARWSDIPSNPLIWFRVAIAEAAHRGAVRFWLTWVFFSAAVFLAVVGLFLACFLLFAKE